MLRSILLPTIIACVIVGPMLYQRSTQFQSTRPLNAEFGNPNNDFNHYVANRTPYSPYPAQPTGNLSSGPRTNFQSPTINATQASTATPLNVFNASTQQTITGSPTTQPFPQNGTNIYTSTPGVDFSQMTPDYGNVETRTFRGNAFGPDLTSETTGFVPVANFQEIFRFDVSPTWVKQRWDRLTTIPPQNGLHGLRTALVTGTNSWDLNGSLTYFFDQNHRIQRLSFRGWVGDPSRLVALCTQHFGFKPRPTHWAGLYLGEFGGKTTGALLMKDPNSIDRRNQVQRTAVIMEINQPASNFKLSDEMMGFIQPAVPTQ